MKQCFSEKNYLNPNLRRTTNQEKVYFLIVRLKYNIITYPTQKKNQAYNTILLEVKPRPPKRKDLIYYFNNNQLHNKLYR